MKNVFIYIIATLAIFTSGALTGRCLAQERGVAVLLSREIAPYVAMVEGLERQLGNRPVQRFFLDPQGRVYGFAGGAGNLEPSQYAALVAVGPGALRYLQDRNGDVPLLFGMILNPENIIATATNVLCGVSLNLSIEAQIEAIAAQLPGMTRLGVLFDPANNQPWFEAATRIATPLAVELVPLPVVRKGERLEILGDLAVPDAILFIPDQTIIAKPVIQHIIKQAVLLRTPVVGYNQYFYDSGAALSFIIDYEKNGQQVAIQIENLLAGGPCPGVVAPAFTTRVNPDVLRLLQQVDQESGL